MASCLYIGPFLDHVRVINHDGLDAMTERHRIELDRQALLPCLTPLTEFDRLPFLDGAVIEMHQGWAGRTTLALAASVLNRKKRVWFYWPEEQAVECIDRERLHSFSRLWIFLAAIRTWRKIVRVSNRVWRLITVPKDAYRALAEKDSAAQVITIHTAAPTAAEIAQRSRAALAELLRTAHPVSLKGAPAIPTPDAGVRGVGVYLRTDYWAQITSGGSYGHTCYVAKELAAVTDRFVCLMASRFAMLDELGLHQVVMPKASESSSETDLLGAHWFYYPQLKLALQALKPAYIYERLCQANFCGAALSHELGIPYIVEYNGSEISMTRSFGGVGLEHEDVFLAAEEAAFKQATMITVVSQVVKDSLVQRGIDAGKILVNPNGADPTAYAPMAAESRAALRAELGFSETDRVIGFTGTFGGWHGIDVLAESIPRICANPKARFLLIGDGTHKHLVDAAVVQHGLADRVTSMGRVPQAEGARLLAACDIFVSPHNSHMVDSKFFGSPTKLFEYMAVGGGIVGSDLEQLGEVLSPALRPADFDRADVRVSSERAVLCTPGDVDEFVKAVVALVERPHIASALGRNARQAVLDSYSWQRHVENVWRFASGERRPADIKVSDAVAPVAATIAAPEAIASELVVDEASAPVRDLRRVQTGDAYKEEVQDQWNNNPVGSHYAKVTKPHTLEWYLEVEQYRYAEYAPWMFEVMEFGRHSGHKVLEIGGGLGTDLSQFARNGAIVTDLDLSAGHLEHAKENFALRGLTGEFVHHDAETLPFPDNTFDVVYTNGVIHHTPNTLRVVGEIRRVLKPGGKAIVMMYAEHSWHYWYRLVWEQGVKYNLLNTYSIGEIMSRKVEITKNDARPLVKVYTAKRLRKMFANFDSIEFFKRQLITSELPEPMQWMPVAAAGKLGGWNIIIKASKPRA
jgi:glycosyltransferase involved in cell wall biosynthesis/ubiquinone/menaquinone biosynthesis C-methylase UbiE